MERCRRGKIVFARGSHAWIPLRRYGWWMDVIGVLVYWQGNFHEQAGLLARYLRQSSRRSRRKEEWKESSVRTGNPSQRRSTFTDSVMRGVHSIMSVRSILMSLQNPLVCDTRYRPDWNVVCPIGNPGFQCLSWECGKRAQYHGVHSEGEKGFSLRRSVLM